MTPVLRHWDQHRNAWMRHCTECEGCWQHSLDRGGLMADLAIGGAS